MSPLRQRMLDALVLRGKAARTQEAYIDAVVRMSGHFGRSPDTLSSQQFNERRMTQRRVASCVSHLLAVSDSIPL